MVTVIAFVVDKDIITKSVAKFIKSIGVNIDISFTAKEGACALMKVTSGPGNIISRTNRECNSRNRDRHNCIIYLETKILKNIKKSIKTEMIRSKMI